MTAAPSSGTPEIIGRSSANYAIRALTSGGLRGLGGSPAPPAGQPTTADLLAALTMGTTYFIALSWDSETADLDIYVNGVSSGWILKPGSITASAGNFSIGGISGCTFDWAGAFFCSRKLGASELEEGYFSGVNSPATTYYITGTEFPNATLTTLSIDGGRRTPTEPTIQTAAGRTYRSDEYGALSMHVARTFPVTGDHETTVPNEASRLIQRQVAHYTRRGYTAKPTYHNGTKFIYAGSSATFDRSTAGIVLGLAAVHKWSRVNPKYSRALNFAKKHGNWLITQQDSVTGKFFTSDGTPSTWFIVNYLAQAALMFGDDLGSDYDAWVLAVEKGCTFINSTSEKDYYVNGNIELLAALDLYLAYKLTGSNFWLNEFNAQWAHALYTPTGAGSQRGTVTQSGETIVGLINNATA